MDILKASCTFPSATFPSQTVNLLKTEKLFAERIIVEYYLQGLQFLHQSRLGYHGNLKSKTCLIDATWRVLVANFGMANLREHEEKCDDSGMLLPALAFAAVLENLTKFVNRIRLSRIAFRKLLYYDTGQGPCFASQPQGPVS